MRTWGGREAARLTAAVLVRDYAPDLGYAPCLWCGAPADTADHWPVSRVDGGPDHLGNLVAACRSCNCSRGAATAAARRRPPPSREW